VGQLKRVLGVWNLISLGIGAIIGAGIFVLTGTTAAQYAGPGIVISFMIAAFICLLAGLCYAEFASMIPKAGSAYTYALGTMGKGMAWVIGWDLILEYLFAASTVAVGWSAYATSLCRDIGIAIPDQWSHSPFAYHHGHFTITGHFLNIPAMVIVGMIGGLLWLGIRESARANAIVVAIKLMVIGLFIAFGMAHINPANLSPIIPANTGEWGVFGWSGIIRAAGIIFFAYIGFDAVSTAAQECKNPQRDLPIGILGSLGIATLLYIAVAVVLTGTVYYPHLNVPDPIAVAVNSFGPHLGWLKLAVKLGALAGLSSVILVMLMGQTRIFYAMASDGFLPKFFCRIHPRFQTPSMATIITSVVAMGIAGIFPIQLLSELVSIGTLLAFAIVCIGVLVLRRTRPDLPRPFKTPLVPLVPVLGAMAAIAQMMALHVDTWLRLGVWMLLGAGVYWFYGRRVQLNRDDVFNHDT